MEQVNKENILKDLKLSVNAAGHLLMKANTDEEMEKYVTQSATYKSAILTFTKKLVLITGGMVISGPMLALGLLLTEEISRVGKLKDKATTAKKLKAQYKSIVNNIDRSISAEEDKDEPNTKYINGLKKVQRDIEGKISKLDEYITNEEPRYDYKESVNIELNNLLKDYLSEADGDFYDVEGDASDLEDDAIKGGKLPDKPGKGDTSEEENKESPVDSSEVTGSKSSTSDKSGEGSEDGDDSSGDDTGDEETDEETDEEDGEDTGLDGGETDEPDEPKFGNRRVICDRLLNLRVKLKNSLEILYKLDASKQNESLTRFLEKKILKTVEKITVVIDKQIDTIEYNKLVIYDVYFTEIYLTTNEVITTLI